MILTVINFLNNVRKTAFIRTPLSNNVELFIKVKRVYWNGEISYEQPMKGSVFMCVGMVRIEGKNTIDLSEFLKMDFKLSISFRYY